MCNKLLCYLYRHRIVRRLVLAVVSRKEGGQFYSETLRRIFKAYHQVEVGDYSYGWFSPENINPLTKIGRYCSIAPGVCIFNGNHPLDHLSMHPFFYNPNLGHASEERIGRRWIEIGHDVWLGRNALITPSVKRIGNGAVVGAGAVVTKDVPDFAVVVGNPARIIRYRFDKETIDRINELQWWAKDIGELAKNMDAFFQPFC